MPPVPDRGRLCLHASCVDPGKAMSPCLLCQSVKRRCPHAPMCPAGHLRGGLATNLAFFVPCPPENRPAWHGRQTMPSKYPTLPQWLPVSIRGRRCSHAHCVSPGKGEVTLLHVSVRGRRCLYASYVMPGKCNTSMPPVSCRSSSWQASYESGPFCALPAIE